MPKQSARIDLINRLAEEMQSRWTFADVKAYLPAMGVDIRKPTESSSGLTSKRLYVRDMLQGESNSKLIQIADDLDISHKLRPGGDVDLTALRFWAPGYFRLFISHLAETRAQVAQLRNHLIPYGISGFVAHDAIEPTKDWQNEIVSALNTSDALVAVLTPGFHDSKWTDQEVGFALGRDILVVSLCSGLDPYGFLARSQGMPVRGKVASELADLIFVTLAANQKTETRMAEALVSQLLHGGTESQAQRWTALLDSFERVPSDPLGKLHREAMQSSTIAGSPDVLARLNALFQRHGMSAIQPPDDISSEVIGDDDIPF